jgi:arabinogalactan endo-1,4-beta-galactosidase
MNFDQLRGAVYEYTRGVVDEFKRAGAAPDMIQIGNEINTGMMWPDGRADKNAAEWRKLAQLLQAGRDGAKAALGTGSKTTFLHHVADPHHVVWHMDNLLKHDELPDIIGVSYYAAWHGDLASFRKNLDAIAAKYARPIVVVEVAYPWTEQSFDTYPDVSHEKPAAGMPAHTKEGQAEFYRRFIAEIKATPQGRGAGFMVWEPAWLPNAKFGSPMDNMTLFDQNGAALPSLKAIGEAVKR